MKCEILPDLASNWSDENEIYRMLDKCKELGIKFAKLQLFKKEQVRDAYWDNILTEEMAKRIFDYGTNLGLNVYFTPCYPEAVDICKRIGVKYYKIRFKDRNNPEIYEKLQDVYEPIFVSCGGDPYDTLYCGMKNIIFLYCIHKYPAKYNDYDKDLVLIHLGVSDHTPDLEMFKKWSWSCMYWEMHMASRKGTIEDKWSKTFNEIKELIE